jgi:hypothetical protein
MAWSNRRKIAGIDNNKQNDANIDQFGNLRVRNLIWDTGLLAWIADTGGGGGGGGGHVTVDNWPGNYPTGGLTDIELRATPIDVSGPLTDFEIRATPLPVSGPLTDTQIRATALPVSGPLTDVQLRNSDIKVSLDGESVGVTGPLTDTQLRNTAVPVSGTFWQTTQPVSEAMLAILIDEVSSTVTYIGEAVPGTAQGSALWRIKKIDTSSGVVVTWADGNSNFDNAWTGHAGWSYS